MCMYVCVCADFLPQDPTETLTKVSPLLKVYVSDLLLLLCASLLPYLVSRSCLLEAHWTGYIRTMYTVHKITKVAMLGHFLTVQSKNFTLMCKVYANV